MLCNFYCKYLNLKYTPRLGKPSYDDRLPTNYSATTRSISLTDFFSHFSIHAEVTDTDQDLDPGNDPDSVGSGEQIPERALKAVGAKPGVKHEGSVKTLIEDHKDLEIASVALNPEQVNYWV